LVGQNASDEAAIQTLVSQGRTIDAIKRLREDRELSLEQAKRRVDQLKLKK
jgi:ribosomal protein L7/L12